MKLGREMTKVEEIIVAIVGGTALGIFLLYCLVYGGV